MTKKFRRFIFWIFVILFAAASIVIIFFAQGWRFDFDSFGLVKTGGIFIKTTVSGAKIYVNDKYIGTTTGLLSYTKLIDNLAPKNYNLFIHKEEYYPWNKTVEVKNGLVSEQVSIILLPLNPKKIKIAEVSKQIIADFSFDGKKILIINSKKTGAAKLYDISCNFISNEKIKIATSTELISPDKNKKLYTSNNQIWINYLNDIKEEPTKLSGDKELIASLETPILFLDWFNDSEHIIWLTANELTIAERDNRGGKRNSVKDYLNISPPVFWDNENLDLYFFETIKEKLVLYKINIE